MKTSLKKIQIVLICLVGFYPLLKFDWSSKALILFCLVTIVESIFLKRINFGIPKIKNFLLLGSYYILLVISLFYSEDKAASLKILVQLSPLLIIPFIVSFIDLPFDKKNKDNILHFFVFVNMIYSYFIIYMLFSKVQPNLNELISFMGDYDKFQFKLNENINQNFILFHKPYYSMGFVFSAIFSLNRLFYVVKKIEKTVYIVLFIYFALWIVYAFSFPNVIALFICVMVLLYYRLNKRVFIVFSSVTLLFSSFLLVYKIKDKDVKRGVNFIKSSVSNSKYEINDTRLEIYKSYRNIIAKKNFSKVLFGFGVGDAQRMLIDDYKKRFSQKSGRNLLYFSEEFNSDYWYKHNVSVEPNNIRSPYEIQNADLLVSKISSFERSYNISTKVFPEDKEIYTLSVFAKKNTSEELIVRLGNIDQRVVFDLNEGFVRSAKNIMDAGVIAHKKQWYRCFITTEIQNEGLALFGLTNSEAAYKFASEEEKSIVIWGAQLEKGILTKYTKNDKELLKYAFEKGLNSHNNYLFFLMTSGIVGLVLFLGAVFYLFYKSIREINIIKLTFCVIIALNFMTENILSRHWGLMFFTFMMLLLFTKEAKINTKLVERVL